MNRINFLKRFFSFAVIANVVIHFYGCEIINPAEPVPSYIKIDKFMVTPTPSLGTDSSKITNVIVYIDSKLQGVYPLPVQFPVIESGAHQMLFYPGITVNGISNTRSTYPFYKPLDQTVNLESGKVVVVNPVTYYYPDVVGAWLESFDNTGLSLVKGQGTSIGITKLGAGDLNNYEGLSGFVQLGAAQSYFQIVTDTSYALPKDQTPVYLEMNYKCNNPFTVGLLAVTSTSDVPASVITINPKSTWNKIYIELASTIKLFPDAYYFKVYIEGYKATGVSTSQFYFDNFKLLHE